MAFTDHCDIFGSVHEEGVNRVVRHLMRQRPSLFNYATAIFRRRPDLFCVHPIDAAQSVKDAGNPLFTEQKPLPILGSPVPLGINFCVQLTDSQLDLHPGNVFNLPPELGALPAQRFALHLKACVGIDCPSKETIDRQLPEIERLVVQKKQTVIGGGRADPTRRTFPIISADPASGELVALGGIPALAPRVPIPDVVFEGPARPGIRRPPFDDIRVPPGGIIVADPFPGRDEGGGALPVTELLCFCLELFAVGHFEWGTVGTAPMQWLKPRLDGIEIVDLQPTPMENAIECYLKTVLQLGIFPRLMVPMEKMILDITKMLRDQGLAVGDQISLQPSVVPTDVPNNPAVEEDQLKAFIKLSIVQGGA